MTPEFSRPQRLDALGQGKPIMLTATPEECAALARRFDLHAIDALDAEATLTPGAAAIDAKGRLHASVVQSCVVTGEPVPARIDLPFMIRFVAADAAPEGDEIELSADDCDVMEHDGQVIDLGEAVAQTLLLALDPYPRSPNAEARLKEAGVLSEGEAGPFGALAALRDKLKG
jgi:uncharacterized metal-binding protein YceD (DUF177 family)